MSGMLPPPTDSSEHLLGGRLFPPWLCSLGLPPCPFLGLPRSCWWGVILNIQDVQTLSQPTEKRAGQDHTPGLQEQLRMAGFSCGQITPKTHSAVRSREQKALGEQPCLERGHPGEGCVANTGHSPGDRGHWQSWCPWPTSGLPQDTQKGAAGPPIATTGGYTIVENQDFHPRTCTEHFVIPGYTKKHFSK